MGAAAGPGPAGEVPRAITDLGNAGEDLYDAANAQAWHKAQTLLRNVERAAAGLRSPGAEVPNEEPALRAQLDTLRHAIAARDRATTLEAANQVTYLSAQMTQPYRPPTPTEVLLLDYYGRELDIWAARHDTARLQHTTADLRSTWDRVKPAVVSHHGQKAAQQMDADVKRIEAARTPAEYERAAAPFLDEVDVLERVFTRQ